MKATALIAAYLVGAFLTFGHVFNANYAPAPPAIDCGSKPDILEDYEGNRAWYDCETRRIDAKYSGTTTLDAGLPAAYAGMGWPAYWAGRAAIEVTASAGGAQ